MFDVKLIDRSKSLESGKLRTMKVAPFGDNDTATSNHNLAQERMNSKRPVTFLRLLGGKEDGNFKFLSAWKGFRMFKTGESPRTRLLLENADRWLESDDTEAFQQKEYVARDFSTTPGFETIVKIFSMLSHHNSGIPALDDDETL